MVAGRSKSSPGLVDAVDIYRLKQIGIVIPGVAHIRRNRVRGKVLTAKRDRVVDLLDTGVG
ncbi:hypothetical protein D3C80_2018030 [compost metagenome]